MRGINLSPKTPPSQIAVYKVPCQHERPQEVMKSAQVERNKKVECVKVLEAKSF